MANYLTLDNVKVKGKVVLVRVDFNSEVDPETKKVTSDVRIRAHGETTIKELAEKGAKVVILAHQGREGRKKNFTALFPLRARTGSAMHAWFAYFAHHKI
jgi:phosphoglycerate kinase